MVQLKIFLLYQVVKAYQKTRLVFTVCKACNKLHEIFNTFYKIGRELEDFAQVQANLSVLSMFRIG